MSPARQIRFKDILEGITVHEEVDEVTGLSRLIIVDSPDEKKQPAVEIKGKDGKVNRKYHMPSHAHLIVQDGEADDHHRAGRAGRGAEGVLAPTPRRIVRAVGTPVCRAASTSTCRKASECAPARC